MSTQPDASASVRRTLDVLIAEDDDYTREFMEALFREHRHRATLVSDGLEVLGEVLEAGRHFDVLIIDAQMPRMDGLEATRQLRAHPRGMALPILCISAKASGRTEIECMEAGCDRFLTKPCWDADLFAALREVLLARGVLGPDELI